jgi:signal transduction histidine kinase/CheY-like chemotaxis protein
MNQNKKSLFGSLNWQHMPLLRTLVFVQVGIAVVFSIISMLVAFYYVNERSLTVLNSRKLDLVRIMSPNQEKIRLWANLGMEEALAISLKDIKKIDFIKDIKVRRLDSNQFNGVKEDVHNLIIPENIDSNLPYYLVFRINQTSHASILSTLLIPLLVFLFTFTLIYFSIVFIMKKFFKPLSLLVLENNDQVKYKETPDIEASGEIAVLISKIQKSQQIKILLESEKNNFKLATQLAHDIRSPLEVLKGLKDEMTTFPESSRKRIQLSISRIEEIAFNLLRNHKQLSGIEGELEPEELLGLISSVITEKNIEFRNLPGKDIIESLDSSCYGLFSKIQRGTLKSILSNLINNGFDSFNASNGTVEVSLFSKNGLNVISVKDNGQGIDSRIFEKLFTKGFTTKKTGNGLGLFNAKQDIEAVGGRIEFESEIGKGTTFTISLPKSDAPKSFIGSIDAYKYERIIVLDDDPAFHEVWNKRLEDLESKVEHIHSVEEMLSKYKVLHPKILLLSDFELMDKHLDGIDTILKLNHAEHSVLVTARNEEQAIQDRCLAAGIKLLPKSLVNFISINKELSESSKHIDASKLGDASMVEDGLDDRLFTGCDVDRHKQERLSAMPMVINTRFGMQAKAGAESLPTGCEGIGDGGAAQGGSNLNSNVVLIDDDRLVHLNWKTYCKRRGLEFSGFMSINDFMAASASIDKASRIYIDSNLGDGIKGEIESEKIFILGFLNLYIATGYEKDSIQRPAWIKEVFSKSPENIS